MQESPTVSKLRDSIAYASPHGGEWLKTRDVRTQHAKVVSLLTGLTSHQAWATATLEVRLPPSAVLHAAYFAHLHGRDHDEKWRPRGRAELAALAVPLDDVAGLALDRFGPARLRERAGGPGDDWRGHHYELEWEATRCPTPLDWLAHVEAQQTAKDADGDPRLRLALASEYVAWLDPVSRAPLPFQKPDHYPTFAGVPSGCQAHVVLSLPRGILMLGARLPFERVDEPFLAYDRAIAAALGHALSPKNFRARLANQDGTGTYDRKLPSWRA